MVDADRIRVWIARLAAPLAFFFAATVLVILVQRALESDAGEAGTTATTTERTDTEATPTTTPDGKTTSDVPRSCRRNRYRVQSGDTLESIAAKCEVPLDELLLLNPDIDPLTLNPGDRVRIRSAVETE